MKALLRSHFRGDRIFLRNFPNKWLPRSPDLNPCNFWFWGFLKDRAYEGSIRTLPEWKITIIRQVAAIPKLSLRSIVEQAITHLEYVIDTNGRLNDVLRFRFIIIIFFYAPTFHLVIEI